MHIKKRLLTVLSYFLLISLAAGSASGGDGLRSVAFSGDTAPGTSNDTNFAGFISAPVLNNSGETAFVGAITGSKVNNSNRIGVWSEGGGDGLSLVAQTGDIAPGMGNGEQFTGFFGLPLDNTTLQVHLNNNGQTAFLSFLTNSGQGIWTRQGTGNLETLVRSGNSAPGTEPGVEFDGFQVNFLNPISFNDQNEAVFLGGLTGPSINTSNNFGIWRSARDGEVNLVARRGDPAPGLGMGVVFNFNASALGFPAPSLNNNGSLAFTGAFTGTSIELGNDSGIWKETTENGLSLQVREGSPAPSTAPGVLFRSFSDPALNEKDQIAFVGSLTGAGVDPSNDTGIWVQSLEGDFDAVVLEGELAPNIGSNVRFSGFGPLTGFGSMVLNNEGNIAFHSGLRGPGISAITNNSRSLWKGGGNDELSIVARQGDLAPGTHDATFLSFDSFALNANGSVAFLARTGGNDGIWAEDHAGNLRLVAIEGQQIDISDNPALPDLRTIRFLSFIGETGNDDGRKSGFNDAGQVAFRAIFEEGGEGIFVWSVPEPHTIALLLLGLLALFFQRKSRITKVEA